MKHPKSLTYIVLFLCLFVNVSHGQIKIPKVKVPKVNNPLKGSTDQGATDADKGEGKSEASPNYSNKGRERYVSKSIGRGKLGTKEQPAKDLGNILHLLKPNDIIYIAEGEYLNKSERGADEINVPVKIYAGYDDSFIERDPWGNHKTVFTGNNVYMTSSNARLKIRTDQQREANGQLSQGSEIIVDGIIFDNGPRNRYVDENKYCIRRKASPEKGENPSPRTAGLTIISSFNMKVTVRNCVIMNCAPSQGALSVQIREGSNAVISNNLCVNNTGNGIQLMTAYHGSERSKIPRFEVYDNTCIFNWKFDVVASYGGNAIAMDGNLFVNIHNNAFAFGHYGGVYSKGAILTLKDNLFTGNSQYDLREASAMNVNEIEDESVNVTPESTGNISKEVKFPVAKRWAEIYAQRVEISRAEVDASARASNNGSNQLRRMLGMPLQGNDVTLDADIFLPQMLIEEALPLGKQKYESKYGCAIQQDYSTIH